MKRFFGGILLLGSLMLGAQVSLLIIIRQAEAASPWVVRVENHQIFRQQVNITHVEALTDRIWGTRYPVWSPDSAWLAFTAADGIYRVRADGHQLIQLVSSDRAPPPTAMNGQWIVEVAGWSGNGHQIIFRMGWQERIDGALLALDADYFAIDLSGNIERLNTQPIVTGQQGFAPIVDKPWHGWIIGLIAILGCVISRLLTL